ncbi:MAG: hypothetical protein ABIR15_01295 [Chitinophagaceae bacterium]
MHENKEKGNLKSGGGNAHYISIPAGTILTAEKLKGKYKAVPGTPGILSFSSLNNNHKRLSYN